MKVLPAVPLRLLNPSLVCWILLTSTFGASAQQPNSALPRQNSQARLPEMQSEKSNVSQRAPRLKLNAPVERELKGGQADTYEIRMKKGQFLHVVAEQKGIDVVLVLVDPIGKVLVEANSPNGGWGPELASAIAAMSGVYQAQVKSLDKHAAAGKYEITVEELRKPKPEDRTRIEAETTLFAAAKIRAQPNDDSPGRAGELFEKASALWHSLHDPYEEALCQLAIGDIRKTAAGADNYSKAIDSYNRALALFHEIGRHRAEGESLGNIGDVYYEQGDLRKALEYFSRALSLRRQVGDHKDEADTLNDMGMVYNDLGEKQKALEYHNQALPLWRLVGDRQGEAATLTNMGVVYASLGEKQKALDYFNQALPLRRLAGDRKGEATTLSNIGAVCDDLGEKQKALDYYNQALPLERQVGDRSGEAATLNNIGELYMDLGEKQKALDYLNQALSLARLVGDRSDEATALNNVGVVYRRLGEKQKALDYMKEALPLLRLMGDRRDEAAALNNIGGLYKELGEKQKALDYYNQALPLERLVGDRSDEAVTLHNVGALYSDLGERQKALENYNAALVLFRAVQNPLGEGTALNSLMAYWKKSGNPSLAIFFGKQSVNDYQQIRRNIQGLERGLQKSFLESIGNVYRDLGDLLIAEGRLAEAQQVLDLLKEEEYFEFVRGEERSVEAKNRPVVLNPEEQSSHDAYEKIAGQITTLGREYAELRAKRERTAEEDARLGELNEKLTLANQEMGRFFKTLYVEFGKNTQANQSAENVREQTSGMQSIVRELGPGTVALYTLVGETHYSVIVITATTMQAREYAISAADLREKVAAFLEVLRNPASDSLPASQELYKILIAPIAEDLKGARAQTLMWSLNDVLRYVPMAALHDGKQYLVESYRNVVITPASIARLKDKVALSDSGIAGMGVSKDYDGLGPLPAVPGELRHIIRDAKVPGAEGVIPGTILLDDEFTETRMAGALDRHYSVVHIASHFVLQAGNETNSYLLLGGKDVGGKGYHLTLAELRDDPALTFDGTELLTLSACQTGASGTALNGREVDGLGITAQQKGAKAVLASLWSVADESTALLMADFYKQWLGTPGITKAAALQAAQKKMLHGTTSADENGLRTAASSRNAQASGKQKAALPYAHPFYWAPFILIGNWK